MLARIAAGTERDGRHVRAGRVLDFYRTHRPTSAAEASATVVEHVLAIVPCDAVFVPTRAGTTARLLARFKPAVSASRQRKICQDLEFSYGVCPVEIDRNPDNWQEFGRAWMRDQGLSGRTAMLVAGPSSAHPEAYRRIEFMRLDG